MSILYGVWHSHARENSLHDCRFLAGEFENFKCDFVGEANVDSTAFGCRLLRVYPEDKDDIQPLKCDEALLATDTRLDNRAELASDLKLDPVDFRKMPDSALIQSSYRQWGLDCFRRFSGDFAIAIWDGNSRELVLARDVTGVRPLAYATWRDGAAFASSVPELYHLPSVSRRLDEVAIAAMFVSHATERERTPFEAVKWVCPGTIVRIGERGTSIDCFSSLQARELSGDERRNPAPRIGELLEQSVRRRVRGDGSVVCELSGGFDSSAVTMLAARCLEGSSRNLSAISWTPDPKRFPVLDTLDERNEIEWIERNGNLRCSFTPLFDLDDLDGGLGQSLFRSSFRERSSGFIGDARTILSGWGGDEGVSFYFRGVHPQALFWGGFTSMAKRLITDLKSTPYGRSSPLRLLRAIRGKADAARLRLAFENRPWSIIDPRLKREWREKLAAAHGVGIFRDRAPCGVADCIGRQLTRGSLEWRASKEALDAARIGSTIAYPMQDVDLMEFMLSIDARWFDFSSSRRTLFRAALDSISLELPPNVRKPEEALLAQWSGLGSRLGFEDAGNEIDLLFDHFWNRYFVDSRKKGALNWPDFLVQNNVRCVLNHYLKKLD